MNTQQAKEYVNKRFPVLLKSGHSAIASVNICIHELMTQHNFFTLIDNTNVPIFNFDIGKDGIYEYTT